MHAEQILAFFAFAVVAAVTPGPSNVLVMAAGAHAGWWRGLPCLLGVVAGMSLLMGVAALGLGGMVAAFPALLKVLQWSGAVLLLWLAWKIATAPPPRMDARADPVGFWRALAFQWVNPKAWIVCASAAGTYAGAPGTDPVLRALTLSAVFALASAPSCALWLGFGAALKQWLTDARRSRIFNAAMGILLALSVLMILR